MKLKSSKVPDAPSEEIKNRIVARPVAVSEIGDGTEPPASMDRLIHAGMGRLTGGISPASMALAYFDWALHLAESPQKWKTLQEKAVRKATRLSNYTFHSAIDPDCAAANAAAIDPLPQDARFSNPAWQHWPFNVIQQGFLLNQQWWHNATTGIGGVSAHHEQVVSFMARQLLDMVSPLNFFATNPEVQEATVREGGKNLLRGAMNFIEDQQRRTGAISPRITKAFQPGKDVAVTKGSVVYRNRLIELIQYAPVTEKVNAEPILIVPAWIMKYYILDLAPENSLVNYLVHQGHTVFMVSWRNPRADDRDLGLEDYLELGVLEAIRTVQCIVPTHKINTVGYCLGGTLLSIVAAHLAQRGDTSLNSMTLLAAQTDFTEAGELTLFIDESQVNFLDDIMWSQGYLDSKQMAGAFQLLRSNDLIWSSIVQDYLMGQRSPMTALMAWNADATRMPYRMHSDYLRQFFLNNDLFEGRYKVNGKQVALSDIDVPLFVVSTETDHVAPWKSVYKINLVTDTDVAFLLTSGGHNAGIVSEPGHHGRHFRFAQRLAEETYIDPDTWRLGNETVDGSWWPVWAKWLQGRSTGRGAAPSMGNAGKGYPVLATAPGTYVLEH